MNEAGSNINGADILNHREQAHKIMQAQYKQVSALTIKLILDVIFKLIINKS